MIRPDDNIAQRHRFGDQEIVPLTKSGRNWLLAVTAGCIAFWAGLIWWMS